MKYFHAHHVNLLQEDIYPSIAFYDDIDDPIDFVILSQDANNELILTLNDTDSEFINVIEKIKLLHDTVMIQIKPSHAERVDYDYIEIECDENMNDIRASLKIVCQHHNILM
ncbi:hypothetical protein P256_00898 [Acinetobacter nectaris CIP 110549]|uniref:Uncharacterized protein n=1 Tax=Acinetobacter nectaris CIP 110549 TaxID=1392540 RepID=V2TQW2_9GAMM|nr:hypothetical protein [Acinetobacter nectaris]ESK40446.1 hypothetical protein P256_00898 [Acinetobacter nectaris CIP 110549]